MSSASARRVLVVAPHADDETLGAGGTIARHAREGDDVHVAVVTGHGDNGQHPIWPPSRWEKTRAGARAACRLLGVTDLQFEEVPAALVADQPGWQLNKVTGAIVERVQPDVLYVPFPMDLHKDHREVFHSLSVAWRASSPTGARIREIYCYEVQSETHWNVPYVEQGFLPTSWVDIGDTLEAKLQALACYENQVHPAPHPRSLEAVRALAVWRGSLMGMRAAEAFVTVRTLRPAAGQR
jgi:LmbE family N-acetylglucosaminyl deacetylase